MRGSGGTFSGGGKSDGGSGKTKTRQTARVVAGSAVVAGLREAQAEKQSTAMKSPLDDLSDDSDEETDALCAACLSGKPNAVRRALNAGDIDVCVVGSQRMTPLFIACQNGRTEIASMLLDARADAGQACFGGATPLYIACSKNRSELVKLLLKAGAPIDGVANGYYTPLLAAVTHGSEDSARVLCNAGASINFVSDKWGSLLHAAAKGGKVEMCKLLVGFGADLDASFGECTPEELARNRGHSEVASVLKRAAERRAAARPAREAVKCEASTQASARWLTELIEKMKSIETAVPRDDDNDNGNDMAQDGAASAETAAAAAAAEKKRQKRLRQKANKSVAAAAAVEEEANQEGECAPPSTLGGGIDSSGAHGGAGTGGGGTGGADRSTGNPSSHQSISPFPSRGPSGGPPRSPSAGSSSHMEGAASRTTPLSEDEKRADVFLAQHALAELSKEAARKQRFEVAVEEVAVERRKGDASEKIRTLAHGSLSKVAREQAVEEVEKAACHDQVIQKWGVLVGEAARRDSKARACAEFEAAAANHASDHDEAAQLAAEID